MSKAQPIAIYDEFRAQLAELREHNNSVVFDYASTQGNKQARSHIYKLRKTKTAVDKARKKEKAASLDYGRRVDSEAKEIITEIDSMIEVHLSPIQELERIEQERIDRITDKLSAIHRFCEDIEDDDSMRLKDKLSMLRNMDCDDMEELKEKALDAKAIAELKLINAISSREKQEAEQLELARLREEQERREQKEREERIAREAAENAKRELEAKAQKEKEEAIKREERLRIEKEEAERRQREAEERAKDAARLAEIRLQEEQRKKAEHEAREKAEREANKKHKAKINNLAVDALLSLGLDAETAKRVVSAVANNKIPNISIHY